MKLDNYLKSDGVYLSCMAWVFFPFINWNIFINSWLATNSRFSENIATFSADQREEVKEFLVHIRCDANEKPDFTSQDSRKPLVSCGIFTFLLPLMDDYKYIIMGRSCYFLFYKTLLI